jgi:hypothetical protein
MSRAGDAMREDLLVEELAKRLYEIGEGNQQPWAETPLWVGRHYHPIAREAIRQMEFVRAQCLEQVAGGRHDAPRWAYEVHTAIKEAPLTLAPEDWKPE